MCVQTMGLSILDFDKLNVKELKLKNIDLFKMILKTTRNSRS